MFRNKPRLKYSGVTVVLSNPSRFDTANLLSATGGSLFNDHCLRPEYNVMQCDVRVMEDRTPWLPDTKCIILCGEAAMHSFCPDTQNNTLNELRGSPLYIDGIPTIATLFPQDAADFKSYEQQLNTNSKEYEDKEGSEEDEDQDSIKRFSRTKRSNYAFWIKQDIRKCKELLRTGIGRWPTEPEPTYKIYPSCDETVNVLRSHKNCWMDFDIETDYEDQNLLCFAFTFDGKTIYSVPVLNHEYQWSYDGLHYILRALAIAIRDNILVAHNGASFDFYVLGAKYRIPIVRAWDTMITQHRIYPDIEKSLGHVTSMWTHQRFHKDTDSEAYRTRDHFIAKLKYCAKDVFTMHLVRKAQEKYATTIPGLVDSIACAQRSIRPYLIPTIMGLRYDEEKRRKKVAENDRLMTQYLRCIKILIGEQGLKTITANSVKGKHPGAFPSSNKQCVEYFHNILGYPVVQRNPPDKHGVRHESLAKRAMLKLRLKHENPVIDFINLYRYTKLECTTPLGFTPYRDDNNKIIKPEDWDGDKGTFKLRNTLSQGVFPQTSQ